MISVLPTLLRAVALAGLAALAALLSNGLASPARKLAWRGVPVPLPHLATQPEPSATPALPPAQPSTPATAGKEVPRVAAPRPIQTPPAPGAAEAPAAPAPIREIGSREAWAAFQAGNPFLDARRSTEFAEGHIAGAFSTPVWESDVDDRLFAFKIARRPGAEDPIVIYCSGGDCQDSHLLASKLLGEGYFRLLIYREGFPDWVAQQRPVEKGRP